MVVRSINQSVDSSKDMSFSYAPLSYLGRKYRGNHLVLSELEMLAARVANENIPTLLYS